MRGLIAFAVLLSGSAAHAVTWSEFESSVSTLRDFLRPHVGRLERPLVTYRYSQDHDWTPRNFDDVRARLDGRPEVFFDPTQSGQMAGPGTYVAMDPANSREYGGDNPQFFVITLKAGTRVLNVEDSIPDSELAGIRALNARLRCGDAPMGLSDVLDTFRNSKNGSCVRIAMQAVRKLEVGAIVYDFVSPTPFRGCREGRDAAINVISSAAIDFGQLEFYTDRDHFGPSRLAGYTKRLFDLAAADPFVRLGDHPRPPLLLRGETPADFDEWVTRSIFGCGARRRIEGTYADARRPVAFLKQKFRDAGVKALLDQARAAFLQKFKDSGAEKQPDFSLANLRWVEELSWRAIAAGGAPLSLEDYRAAREILSETQALADPSGEGAARLGALLSESDLALRGTSLARLLRPMRTEIAKTGAMDPVANLEASGAGPRAARLITNLMLVGLDAVPFLTWPKSRADEAAAMQKSRAILTRVLRTCLDQYRDPRVTFAEIQKSRCGV